MLDFWATKVYNKITVKEDLMSKAGKSRKGDNMENMGMTDKQFSGFLRFLLDNLKEASEEKDEKKKNEKLNKIMNNIQKTIED